MTEQLFRWVKTTKELFDGNYNDLHFRSTATKEKLNPEEAWRLAVRDDFYFSVEWLEPIPSLNEGSLEQDFKEINVYLNDLYHNMTHGVKDAGHLWIAFNDKFNAFRERVFAASRPSIDIDKVVDAEKVLDFLLTESAEERIDMVDGDFYWREDKDGDQPLEPKDIIKLYKEKQKEGK